MKAPHGFDEIVKVYGNPKHYIRPDGTMMSDWERHTLALAPLPDTLPLSWDLAHKVRVIRCHQLLTMIVRDTFQAIHDANLWHHLHEFGGCYAARAQRGSSKPSLHLWGAAIDLNPSTNHMGTAGDMSPELVKVFDDHGWTWGGRFGRPDPMHFQYATGY